MYAQVGRSSIPLERPLKGSPLISQYSVRSERAFCEELECNLLFRWFLGMNLMERSFDPTVFTKLVAAASLKSFKLRDGDPPTHDGGPGNPSSVDFHGERRSNTTHRSTTDPESRLFR